jgi:hypothetical protein
VSLVDEVVDDGEGGGELSQDSAMILRFPVTPCAGQPLYDCTMTMITCRGSQFWTWTSPVAGDDKAVR